MISARMTAAIVGVLFIVGTVSGALSAVVTQPILGAADYLARVAADSGQLVVGALLVLTMELALAMVSVLMYPILRKHSSSLAIGYVVFRGGLATFASLEGVICWLTLVPLTEASARAGTLDASSLQAVGRLLLEAAATSFAVGGLVFPVGALMLYLVLYRSSLVPRWLSGWGIISAIPYLATYLLVLLQALDDTSTLYTVLVVPLALQEMVMAVWLIVKGFSPSAVVSGSASESTIGRVPAATGVAS